MGLFGFKQQFVPYILAGEKTHTIRAPRRYPDVPGNTLHLYTGLRQRGPIIQKLASGEVIREKMARLLMRAPCIKVEQIRITAAHQVFIDDQELTADERDLLAYRDGFRFDENTFGNAELLTPAELESLLSNIPEQGIHHGCFALMLNFWTGRLPFEGQIYHWDFSRRTGK